MIFYKTTEKKISLLFFAVLFISALHPLRADTAYHVMDVMCEAKPWECKKSSFIIENIGTDGTILAQKFNLYEKNSSGIKSLAAEEVTESGGEGKKLLMTGKSPSKTEITVYEPGMKSPKKISSSDMKKNIFGTCFPFYMLKNRSVNDDEHEMLGEKEKIKINSKNYTCWKIKSVPISKTVVDYSYRITWVEKETHLPAVIQFYSESKKSGTVLLRTFRIDEFGSVTTVIRKSYDVVKKCSMTDETTGRTTTIHAENFLFDSQIPESIFTSSWIGNKK